MYFRIMLAGKQADTRRDMITVSQYYAALPTAE